MWQYLLQKRVEAFREQKYVTKLLLKSNVLKGLGSLLCDNQAAVKIAHDTGYSGRDKHVKLRIFVIHYFVSHQVISF